MKVKYYLLNPTQNITVIVETPTEISMQPSVAERIMELEPTAEQVGFVSGENLRMAGGEFCGNASMSAAVLLGRRLKAGESRTVELTVSGADGKVPVSITAKGDESFTGTVNMPVPIDISDVMLEFNGKAITVPAVKFGGITHLIFEFDAEKTAIEKSVKKWCADIGADALGVMLLDIENSKLTPLVYVPNAGTMFWESSCASGTSAVGAYLYSKNKCPIKYDFDEPGGVLTVETDGKNLRLTGNVKIIKVSEAEI